MKRLHGWLDDKNITVSIIIPTYNEEDTIDDCIGTLIEQSLRAKEWEIIIVDDGSTDKTKEIIRNFQEAEYYPRINKIQLLEQKHKGPGAARNLGAKHANGKILVFVDSDMTFALDFIENLVEPIIKGRTKGTFSKLEYVSNPDNIWSRCWGINENWVGGMRHPANYPDQQKVFRAILKSEFDKVGGFSLTGYTDDWTLSKKLGYEAISAKAVFYHKNPDNLGEVFKQARWIGKREYKLGKLGTLIALVRASLPISLFMGLRKSVIHVTPAFFIFKIAYDLGVFVGGLQSLLGGSSAK